MELLLVRHGEAAPPRASGAHADRERNLNESGAAKTAAAATALNGLNLRVDAILSSPYPRAMQTAEIFRDRLHNEPELRPNDALSFQADWGRIADELHRNSELRTIMLCGHEPDLSAGATMLLGGRHRPSLLFHTGSIAAFHVDLSAQTLQASLRWFMNSHQLDLLARAFDVS